MSKKLGSLEILESIPGLLKRLQFRALDFNGMEYGPQHAWGKEIKEIMAG